LDYGFGFGGEGCFEICDYAVGPAPRGEVEGVDDGVAVDLWGVLITREG